MIYFSSYKITLSSLEADVIWDFKTLAFFSKSLSLPARLLACSLIDFSSSDTVFTQVSNRSCFSLAADFNSSSSCSILFTSSLSYIESKNEKQKRTEIKKNRTILQEKRQHDDKIYGFILHDAKDYS